MEYFSRKDVEEWVKRICEDTESETEYFLSRIDEIPTAYVASSEFLPLPLFIDKGQRRE